MVVGGGKVLGAKRKREPCKLYIVSVYLGYKISSLSCQHLSFKNKLSRLITHCQEHCSLLFLLYSAPETQ